METIKVAFSNDMPQEIHFSFCSPEFHAIINIPTDVWPLKANTRARDALCGKIIFWSG